MSGARAVEWGVGLMIATWAWVAPPAAAESAGLPAGGATEIVALAESGPRARLDYASTLFRQPPATSQTKRTPRRMRTNTIDLGLQISYGVVNGTSRLADGFNSGPGYAFRFRYALKPSFALGFSFENQNYYESGGQPSTEPGAGDSSVVMTTVSVEGVFYVHRERETNPFFLGGLGHASPDVVDENRGSTRVNEGIYLVLGAGLERFIRDRFSIDFEIRGYGLVSNSELTSFLQFCAGIQIYPGD